jgi:hypothetical protein
MIVYFARTSPRCTKSFSLTSLVRNHGWRHSLHLALILPALLVFAPLHAAAQAVTVDSTGHITNGHSAPVDRRFAQVQPTKVDLPKTALDARGHQELIRTLLSEQGFAMRPFPRGHKGLELVANGKLKPAGEEYVAMVTNSGLAAKPGERIVITNLKIENTKIIFDLNGGPDPKHRYLSHISIGAGEPGMEAPIVQGDEQAPTGARLTLEFKDRIPMVTPEQVKDLLAPLISFGLKTPIEAYTETLPTVLKEAIFNHHVMVGMSTDMVLFALGEPQRKSREVEEQMPFEEWIYGQPPADVQFVRINGNRVIRVEIAKVGYPPKIYTKDEVSGMMRTDGTALAEEKPKEHTLKLGDVRRDPDTQSPAPAPTLAAPGEKLDIPKEQGQSTKVRFPKPDDSTGTGTGTDSTTEAGHGTGAGTGSSTGTGSSNTGTSTGTGTGTGTTSPTPSTPATTQPATPVPEQDKEQQFVSIATE